MKQRLCFLLILAFWGIMNLLLWRAEYSAQNQLGAPVAVNTVWERIITAPDSSSLEIFHRNQKLGLCRWIVTISEERASERSDRRADTVPDGMVKKVSGYTIDFDGNLILKDLGGNLRFYFRLNLATNQAWRDLHLRMAIKPAAWEVFADAAQEQVVFRLSDGEGDSEHLYTFQDLANPQNLLKDFELPAPLAFLMTAGISPPQTNRSNIGVGLVWEARNDTLKIGSAAIRVYRLQARLFDRYHLVVYVSRAGEILRVELPGDVIMINYALTTL
jgi:hypothetical protein